MDKSNDTSAKADHIRTCELAVIEAAERLAARRDRDGVRTTDIERDIDTLIAALTNLKAAKEGK